MNDELAERISRLERANRRLVAVLAIGLGALVVATMAGAQKQADDDVVRNIIRAKRFVLEDEAGAVRGVWSVRPDGSCAIALQHSGGKQIVRLYSGEQNGSGLQVDENDKIRVSLAVADEGPSLRLQDAQERAAIDITAKPDGWSRVNVVNPNGGGVNLSTKVGGPTNIGLFGDTKPGEDGEYRIGLQISKDRSLTLAMKGEKTKTAVLFGLDKNENPLSTMVSKDGKSTRKFP